MAPLFTSSLLAGFPLQFHLRLLHTILDERLGIFSGKVYMLEIAAIIFIVLTIPLWLPLVAGIVTSLLSFGFMAVFWLILIGVVIFLLLT